ncbi:MAG TPA: hypothetical protein VFH71_04610 [Rhodanobacteraceae bacterium]|nr:hypothetical protein [Rhodanobacteraceae bacterium]
MPRAAPCLAVLVCLSIAISARAQIDRNSGVSAAQVAAVEKSEAIMRRAQQRKGLLAQYQVMRYAYNEDSNSAFRAIFGQYLSWYQTFIGDYSDALQSFSIREQALTDDNPSPLVQPGYHAVPALAYLPKLAKNYRAVFLNEAHNVPLTRSLTVQLLKDLREEGFNYFAVETLYHTDTGLQQRGYPTAASGFYMREPVYAEMVRTALKLGYKVVAYEADDEHTGDARERQQAEHLYDILKHDPNAKLVVNAGYAHIQEQGKFLGAQSMAEHFRAISDMDPLTIEQTMLIPHGNSFLDHPDYSAIVQSLHPTQPVVFINAQGQPWSLRPGYDASVIFPETKERDGRPTWLTLGGLRVPDFVDGNLCQDRYPCLIEARYADEGDDAIPADRLVLDTIPLMLIGSVQVTTNYSALPAGELYLRPGRYRLSAVDQNGRQLYKGFISITANPGSQQAQVVPACGTPGPGPRTTASGSKARDQTMMGNSPSGSSCTAGTRP